MSLRSLSLAAFVAVATLTEGAVAAPLPTSTLTVNILSVDRESSKRDETRYPGRPLVVFETTWFRARALIAEVLKTDHKLTAGAVIDIRYSITVREPPDPAYHVRPALSAGETKTVTVFGDGDSFIWRN